jgi:hypothetical protein
MHPCTWLIVRVAENPSQREWSHYMARKWLPGMPKPRWDARNQSEKEAMRDWVFYQIEEALRARRKELLSASTNLRDLHGR